MLLYPLTVIATLATSGVFALPSSAVTVSPQCQLSLAAIAASPDAQCLNAAGVLPIFLTGQGASIVGPINTWLTGLCSKDACSNQTLSTVVFNITQGCSSDLGISSSNVLNITTSVEQFYPTARQILCLNDTSDKQLCAVDQLYSIQNSTGTITVDNFLSLVPQIITAGLPVGDQPQNMSCNNCTKEAYNIILANDPQAITSGANSSISNKCGASFLDGKTPGGISQTATKSTLPKTSGEGNGNGNGPLRPLPLWDGFTIVAGLGVFLAALL
ncbi:hypothetical protein BJV78DRAFT_1187757 [Lactifluus subvellereus]|nr:hypothetical protein BJV78DRAFT_1187757 [Lactifluus subvellereus]